MSPVGRFCHFKSVQSTVSSAQATPSRGSYRRFSLSLSLSLTYIPYTFLILYFSLSLYPCFLFSLSLFLLPSVSLSRNCLQAWIEYLPKWPSSSKAKSNLRPSISHSLPSSLDVSHSSLTLSLSLCCCACKLPHKCAGPAITQRPNCTARL